MNPPNQSRNTQTGKCRISNITPAAALPLGGKKGGMGYGKGDHEKVC
jgi:hypothetical protein